MTRQWLYFEDSLRLAEILAGTAGGEGVEVARLRYHYDLGGNIIRMRDYRNSSQVQCFGYDTVNRLVSAFTSDADDGVAPCDDGYHATGVGPYSLLYTYNKIGNVTKVVDEVVSQTVNYSYGASGAGPHAVTSAGGVSYGYDGNGNMVSRGGDGLTFNQRNRLVAYQAGAGGETRFVYDADGNRLQRRAPDGWVLTSLDGLFERTVAGSTVTDRVWYTFGGQTVGSHTKTNTTGGQRAWIVTDHLNTHGIEVDAATGAVGRAFFDPFGAPRGVAGAGVTTDIGYTGQRRDTTTGLMHYQSRYYDPALRRFISPDTIIPDPANPQDLNRYTYTRNNPTRYNDPTGHAVDSPNDCPGLWSRGICGSGETDSTKRGFVAPPLVPSVAPSALPAAPLAPWVSALGAVAIAAGFIKFMEFLENNFDQSMAKQYAEAYGSEGQFWADYENCISDGTSCYDILVFRVSDATREGSENGAWWTPLDPTIFDGYCGDTYCGPMEILALPPMRSDGVVNQYNVVYAGVVDMADLGVLMRVVESQDWSDGTSAGGGGIEFIIPRGCAGAVQRCIAYHYPSPPYWPKD